MVAKAASPWFHPETRNRRAPAGRPRPPHLPRSIIMRCNGQKLNCTRALHISWPDGLASTAAANRKSRLAQGGNSARYAPPGPTKTTPCPEITLEAGGVAILELVNEWSPNGEDQSAWPGFSPKRNPVKPMPFSAAPSLPYAYWAHSGGCWASACLMAATFSKSSRNMLSVARTWVSPVSRLVNR